jgi:hypothetical protein
MRLLVSLHPEYLKTLVGTPLNVSISDENSKLFSNPVSKTLVLENRIGHSCNS